MWLPLFSSNSLQFFLLPAGYYSSKHFTEWTHKHCTGAGAGAGVRAGAGAGTGANLGAGPGPGVRAGARERSRVEVSEARLEAGVGTEKYLY